MKRIFVLGSLNTDLVMETPYMPEAGETLTGNGFAIHFGGKGANQAAAASRLGGKVRMAGCVGDDGFGRDSVANLNRFGVDTGTVRTVAGESSGVAMITVCEGNNRILLHPGANARVTEADADALLADAVAGDIFLTQLETPLSVAGYALKAAKEKGMITILNPAPANRDTRQYFPFVDIITPNETETAIFAQGADLTEATSAMGVPHVVVTLGGKGWYYHCGELELYGDCPKVKVVDTTAAGDTFCGALSSRLAMADGVSLTDAIRDALPYASRCASAACTKHGAQSSIPTPEEVEEMFGN